MGKFSEISGDLFTSSKDSCLAHCVSADLRMGKGIALKFRSTFGQIPKLKSQNPKVGGAIMIKDKNRYIYYLITKQLVYHKPTYESMYSSLSAMRQHMKQNGMKKLAIPRIGCGLDGLLWPKVKNQIKEIFADDDIEIFVYEFARKN